MTRKADGIAGVAVREMTPHSRRMFFSRLRDLNPNPTTELRYGNTYQLLVAVVLSAQATDTGVNAATESIFREIETPAQMLALGESSLSRSASARLACGGPRRAMS